jgi:hypothetical protein
MRAGLLSYLRLPGGRRGGVFLGSYKSLNPLHSLGVRGFRGNNCLTMSYFHTGIRTIIGAEAFHCPVRDGKEWDHLAMVIRHNRSPRWFSGQRSQFAESVSAVLIASPEAVQFRTTAAYIAYSFWSFEP